MIHKKMNALKSAPRHWVPGTDRERALVLQELEGVIASSQFCNSKRYPSLLRYVVETTLAGQGDQLKERTLGIEVFHRPPDYDTNADTVVRYTAGEVRKRLAVYYHEHAESPLQIALPAGSYVPEFLLFEPEPDEALRDEPTPLPDHPADVPVVHRALLAPNSSTLAPHLQPGNLSQPARSYGSRLYWLLAVCILALAAVAGWRSAVHRNTALDAFWTPMLHERGQTVLCVGGVTFADNNFSGTHTAGKDTAYPFASMQIVSSVSQISGLLERGGASYGVRAAPSTQVSELREHPLVLLGGYNNEWTMRLLTPLRFHFAAEPNEVIVDTEHPDKTWARDRAQPYASADDYALVARFRDSVTGSLVVVAAGLGRNGTELAAQFLTSERYMELLQQKVGGNLGSANIEVLLHSRVIDGRTGAPQIEAVHTW